MATKWGIVGAGKISNDFVAAVKSLNNKEHEFVAVSARNLSSAESFASTHGIPKTYGSYEELAIDPDVEVVYIGIINSGHFSVGKLMLEKGKHVLIEKPMTLNVQQTMSLIDIARRGKRFLMEALWSRFLPSYSCLMDLIRKGSIGDVVHVQANLGINMMYRERMVTKALGGGTVLDLGIYPLNAVTMIYNGEQPSKIAAVGHLNEDGERPFACDHPSCGKQFTRNEELTRHKRIHTGVRPHPCILCGKRFGRKDHLKKHVKTHQRTNVVRMPISAFQGLSYFVSDCIPWY